MVTEETTAKHFRTYQKHVNDISKRSLPRGWLKAEWVEKFCVKDNGVITPGPVDDAALFLWVKNNWYSSLTMGQYRTALRRIVMDSPGYCSPLKLEFVKVLNDRMVQLGKRKWGFQQEVFQLSQHDALPSDSQVTKTEAQMNNKYNAETHMNNKYNAKAHMNKTRYRQMEPQMNRFETPTNPGNEDAMTGWMNPGAAHEVPNLVNCDKSHNNYPNTTQHPMHMHSYPQVYRRTCDPQTIVASQAASMDWNRVPMYHHQQQHPDTTSRHINSNANNDLFPQVEATHNYVDSPSPVFACRQHMFPSNDRPRAGLQVNPVPNAKRASVLQGSGYLDPKKIYASDLVLAASPSSQSAVAGRQSVSMVAGHGPACDCKVCGDVQKNASSMAMEFANETAAKGIPDTLDQPAPEDEEDKAQIALQDSLHIDELPNVLASKRQRVLVESSITQRTATGRSNVLDITQVLHPSLVNYDRPKVSAADVAEYKVVIAEMQSLFKGNGEMGAYVVELPRKRPFLYSDASCVKVLGSNPCDLFWNVCNLTQPEVYFWSQNLEKEREECIRDRLTKLTPESDPFYLHEVCLVPFEGPLVFCNKYVKRLDRSYYTIVVVFQLCEQLSAQPVVDMPVCKVEGKVEG